MAAGIEQTQNVLSLKYIAINQNSFVQIPVALEDTPLLSIKKISGNSYILNKVSGSRQMQSLKIIFQVSVINLFEKPKVKIP